MTYKAYLTIDDSPSDITDNVINFLEAEAIPALIFVRGDFLENHPAPIIRAIEKGYIIGNHLYSHQRASRLTPETVKDEILRTEALIEQAYHSAAVSRPFKAIRFPYLDRAMGAWFIEPDTITNTSAKERFEDLIEFGLGNNKSVVPTAPQIDIKNHIQDFLKSEGFAAPTFSACTASWYRENPCIKDATDTLITCSSSDWMLTQRHKEKWAWNNVADLSQRMLERFTQDGNSAQIILLHDQSELQTVFIDFIKALKSANIHFLPIA